MQWALQCLQKQESTCTKRVQFLNMLPEYAPQLGSCFLGETLLTNK